MHLSLQDRATTFFQRGFDYGFAFFSDKHPYLWYHVLTPAILDSRPVSTYRTGTIMVYVIDNSNPDIFTPKDMPAPRRDIIEALRVQWDSLSKAYLRQWTERLDKFEEEEDIEDDDDRWNIEASEMSFSFVSEFFAAPDFDIAASPAPGTMGYLISARPLPSQAQDSRPMRP